MRARGLTGALLVTVGVAGCADGTLPADEWLRVTAGEGQLSVQNRGGRPVYLLANDPTSLALLMGCSPDTDRCARVAPGATLRIPYSGIISYDPGDRQAAVAWWVFADGRTVKQGTVTVDL